MKTEHLLMMQDPNETCNWHKETAGHCGNSVRPAVTITGFTGSRKELEKETADLQKQMVDAAYYLIYGEPLVS